jgi:hypothetical protein
VERARVVVGVEVRPVAERLEDLVRDVDADTVATQ